MIKLILARALNNVIGNKGVLAWHLPEDLKLFKAKTQGHVVLMGRNTWDGLPITQKPLPGRINAVVTTHLDTLAAQTPTPHEAFNLAYETEAPAACLAALTEKYPDKDIWVIGGQKTYEVFLPFVDEIHETLVALEPEGDSHGFDPAALPNFGKTVGMGSTPSWTTAQNGISFRVNVYARHAAHIELGRKPWHK